MKKKKYITPKTIRTRFGVSISHIYKLLRDPVDPLPHYRIGAVYKIDEDEFEAWLNRHHRIMNTTRR